MVQGFKGTRIGSEKARWLIRKCYRRDPLGGGSRQVSKMSLSLSSLAILSMKGLSSSSCLDVRHFTSENIWGNSKIRRGFWVWPWGRWLFNLLKCLKPRCNLASMIWGIPSLPKARSPQDNGFSLSRTFLKRSGRSHNALSLMADSWCAIHLQSFTR